MKQIDLYLDFDGVLNFLRLPRPEDSHDVITGTAQGFILRWHQANIDWLNGLPENVNLVWLTTWNDHNLAVEVLTPLLGITRPVSSLGYVKHHGGWPWWKQDLLMSARISKGESNPYIWVDDDLQYEEPWRQWPDIPERLMVSPNASIGVDAQDRERIDRFIQANS